MGGWPNDGGAGEGEKLGSGRLRAGMSVDSGGERRASGDGLPSATGALEGGVQLLSSPVEWRGAAVDDSSAMRRCTAEAAGPGPA